MPYAVQSQIGKSACAIYLGNFETADFFINQGIMPDVGLIIPTHLARQDFDWPQSRPLKAWRQIQDGGIFQDWRRDRIELLSADVTKCSLRWTAGSAVACRTN